MSELLFILGLRARLAAGANGSRRGFEVRSRRRSRIAARRRSNLGALHRHRNSMAPKYAAQYGCSIVKPLSLLHTGGM